MNPRESISWKVQDFGRDDPLNGDQIASLSEEFGLDEAALEELSRGLRTVLNPRLGYNRDEVDRTELKTSQKAKAVREVEKAIKELSAAERKLFCARELLGPVRFENLFAHGIAPNPATERLRNFAESVAEITSFRKFLEAAVRSDLVTYAEIPDKRRARDDRRWLVCEYLFSFWEESGRNVSYTTDSVTSERGGALVNFVNAVVHCISDPPGQLSGSAIKSEIEGFKNRREEYLAANAGQVFRSRKK
jgi:hypothetical protein